MTEINIGNLEFYNEIEIGDLQLDVKNVYPELEKITVQSKKDEQLIKPTKYGFSEITVKAMVINLQNKEVIPSVNEKIIIGTSFGALSSLFVAEKESKNNTLGISKYIAISPPVIIVTSGVTIMSTGVLPATSWPSSAPTTPATNAPTGPPNI